MPSFRSYSQVRAAGLTVPYAHKLQGVDMVLRQLGGLEREVIAAGRTGLKRAALALLRDSQKIVPVDTGALRASGRVTDKTTTQTAAIGAGYITGSTYTVYVSYTVYYALYVHEMTMIPRRNGKMAKFVEIPLRANIAKYVTIIDVTITQRTGKIGGVYIV